MVSNLDAVASTLTREQWQAGADWYATAHAECVTMSTLRNVSVSTAAAIVAALSPQTQWSVNLRAAWRLLGTGEREPATLASNHRRALGVLDGSIDPESWQAKIGRFWRNLSGDLTCATVDTWAWAMLTGDELPIGLLKRKGAYAQCEQAFLIVADRYGQPPAVVQAATWIPYRRKGYITRMDQRLGR